MIITTSPTPRLNSNKKTDPQLGLGQLPDDESRTNTRNRITSIDALRAITLFGILLVHASGLFGWGGHHSSTAIGEYAYCFISLLLVDRCNTIFGILFGVSFYLILRNPAYTTQKFVWRCLLLFLIGLFNKLFYTWDALMWYGICGMVLACFRKLSVKQLWISFIVIYILNLLICYTCDLKGLLFGSDIPLNRYKSAESIMDVVAYPVWNAALDYVRVAIGSPLGSLSKFLLGYCLAKSGVVEDLKRYASMKNFVIFTVLYMVLVIVGMKANVTVLNSIGYLFGSLCYATLFLLVYYKSFPFFRFLEPYGKLGLTNYSLQGIIGVLLAGLVFIPYHWSFESVLITTLLFYILQVLFSIVWLKYYKYGPFEWLWRCMTEKEWFSNKKNINL